MSITKGHVFWLGLALLTVLSRLPYFFVDVIDWDESTFILMAQGIHDGMLPYAVIWDNKPPLIFTIFAGVLALPGDAVVVTRIVGAACVFATAALIHVLTKPVAGSAAAIVAPILYVLGMSTVGSGQAVTSELVSTVLVLGAMAALLRGPSMAMLGLAGALLSMATLIRLNLAFVVIVCGLWILVTEYRRAGTAQTIRALLAYAIAGLSILLLCAAPYLLAGEIELFWYSVFQAPFRYATTQESPLSNLVQHAYNAMGLRIGVHPGQLAFGLAAWALAPFGVLWCLRRWPTLDERARSTLSMLLAAVGAMGLSILLSGVAPLHYLIALLPWVTLFAGVIYEQLIKRGWTVAVVAVITVAGIVMLQQTASQYRQLGQRIASDQSLQHGASFSIADYLDSRCGADCSVYLLEDHLAYVLMGKYPPRKIVTHPSNISKPSLLGVLEGTAATPEAEMQALLETQPNYIVKKDRVWYLRDSQVKILEAELARSYELAERIDDRSIYKRRSS